MTIRSVIGGERESNAVVAIALAGRPWAVIEDMTLMTTTASAVILPARKDQFEIQLCTNGFWQGLPEAWPPRSTVVFAAGGKQGQITTGAVILTRAFLLV